MSHLFSFILLLLAGCSGNPKPPASDSHSSEMKEVDTLRSTKPQLVFDLPKTENVSDVIEVVVSSVSNPTKKAVIVDVFLSGKGNDEKLGSFTLYPSDHPGSYIFRIPKEKTAAIESPIIKLVLKNPQWFDKSFYLVINPPGWFKH